MLLFYYYVPETHLEIVNEALFRLGLGQYEGYDSCCWVVKGQGQFRPLKNSSPFIGKAGQNHIEKVAEYKVEIICSDNLKEAAAQALLASHPYEMPAYGFLQMII